MKYILTILITLFLSFSAKSQIGEGTWLTGGSANLSSSNFTYSYSGFVGKGRSTNINISPVIGYFIVDKFAVGAKPSLSYENSSSISGTTRSTHFDIGPFVRYYFLPADNVINLFAEANYQYGFIKFQAADSKSRNTFSFYVGPVVYFNSSVGLELFLGYYIRNEKFLDGTVKTNSFQINVGFQIQLKK